MSFVCSPVVGCGKPQPAKSRPTEVAVVFRPVNYLVVEGKKETRSTGFEIARRAQVCENCGSKPLPVRILRGEPKSVRQVLPANKEQRRLTTV